MKLYIFECILQASTVQNNHQTLQGTNTQCSLNLSGRLKYINANVADLFMQVSKKWQLKEADVKGKIYEVKIHYNLHHIFKSAR